ncbi:hypothetical protein [Pleurocapsa sp. CCALA 161]|uniref:hypothetical protein n=1 Tax=Pleurocapsa sp. CCALA 161 TaxID=2107688 RepID=UPI0018EB52B3|nr:hypothetical protein [Pleurocapsa sp. CCALA 161]
MVHLVLCFSVWTIIFTSLFWRSLAVVKQAVQHLQRLHQIPCDKCIYFTGDYRLKCTVNPTVAMSEKAIGCRDFLRDNQRSMCNGCQNQCSNTKKIPKYSRLKAQFINFFK